MEVVASIEKMIGIGERQIAEQEGRIAEQQHLVGRLYSGGYSALAADAKDLLTGMVLLLSQMRRDVAVAKKRLRDQQRQTDDEDE